MQVILLPRGSGPSRNFQLRIAVAGAAVAAVLVAALLGGGYLGYRIGAIADDRNAEIDTTIAGVPAVDVLKPAAERSGGKAGRVSGHEATDAGVSNDNAYARVDPHSPVVPHTMLTAVQNTPRYPGAARHVDELRRSVDEQRHMLREARRRLGDQLESLGQRLGRIQAHVTRLNALGQRLTDMAGLDRGEFSFDGLPAIGGPDRSVPWEPGQPPDFAESLEMIEIALEEKETELSILEALLTDRELHEKQYPRGWPTASGGWMSSSYGYRTDPFTGRRAFHSGVDIAARSGSEIRAMAAGVVSFAGRKPGYGLVVEINHGNGYETRYAHAREITARPGYRVEKGDAIALIGSTGRSTGPHVHVEVLKNGETINPYDHLHSSG